MIHLISACLRLDYVGIWIFWKSILIPTHSHTDSILLYGTTEKTKRNKLHPITHQMHDEQNRICLVFFSLFLPTICCILLHNSINTIQEREKKTWISFRQPRMCSFYIQFGIIFVFFYLVYGNEKSEEKNRFDFVYVTHFCTRTHSSTI